MHQHDALYRSKDLAKRCFREPGQLHLHLDARDLDFLKSLIAPLERDGSKVKLNRVLQSVEGANWMKAVFASHSSSGEGEECFLSAALQSRPQCVGIVRELLSCVEQMPGVVLEVERVVARWSREDGWKSEQYGVVPPISGHEVGYAPDSTLPIEIHHCFEIHAERPPFDISELRDDLTNRGLSVGTWSRFARGPQLWSYRSTDFAQEFDFEERCREDYKLLERLLADYGFDTGELWVIAEEILGLWKTDLTVSLESSWKNRVPIRTLVGTDDDDLLDFSAVIKQCCETPTEGDCEQASAQTEGVEANIARFRDITETLGLRPVLFELAVTQEWASPVPKDFAAVMVSYMDSSEDPFLLRAWQKSIDAVIENYTGLISPISPIIFHPQTYESGYLFERFDWIVERAYQELFPLGRGGVQSAKESLERAAITEKTVRGVPNSPLRSAACRAYPSQHVTDPAPVRHTLITLCTGVVNQLMKRLKSSRTTKSRGGVFDALAILAQSWIVVVPFRWRSRGVDRKKNRKTRPGGCIFAVVAPKHKRREITDRSLQDLAIRFGWILLRATLEDVYIGDSTHVRKGLPLTRSEAAESHKFYVRLRRALDDLDREKTVPDRIKYLKSCIPDLGQAATAALPVLLMGPCKSGEVWPEILERRYGRARATIYRAWNKYGLVKAPRRKKQPKSV